MSKSELRRIRVMSGHGFDEPFFLLEHSKDLIKAHSEESCRGAICTLHNRSEHKLRSFPQSWRSDRGIMERICSHGVGHPDPDDLRIREGSDDGVHGCDGCCH